ncbi:MAG: UDP-N-acetylmuramate--L-alanine ligase [Thermoguttaceae bacterium]
MMESNINTGSATSILETGQARRAHLVGIGGAGMRAMARVLLDKGWRLSGSDLTVGCDDPLMKTGVRCFSGHAAQQVSVDVECVICSSAIPADNPELRRAAELGIPVLSYAEMLGLLMQGHRGLAVAGTHGKSTATAMAAKILMAAGCDPTVIHGAAPQGGGDGGRAGAGNAVLVEACEFRQNFLHLRPHDAVILNIEPDHFDCYDSREDLESAFARFAALLPTDGRLIVPYNDVAVQRVAAAAGCRIETFVVLPVPGADCKLLPAPDWVAASVQGEKGRYGFDLVHHGLKLGRIGLSVVGRHNVLNALAAAALVADCGLSAEKIIGGLSQFHGLRRRLEPLGTAGGVMFWDDYAHHPSEIAATLQTIREVAPEARVCCLFQPHQALRTARLLDELASSLQNAERVLIADIFRAREGPPQPGEITAADLAARTRALGQDAPALHAPADIQQFLQTRLTPGDVLVVMGAGDIGRIGYGLLDWFREDRAAG